MLIKSIRLVNYKSFFDSGKICLGSGFNFIVGKNNSGKTALIETIKLELANVPHKSSLTIPNEGSLNNRDLYLEVEIELSGTEVLSFVQKLGRGTQIRLLTPHDRYSIAHDEVFDRFTRRDHIQLRYRITPAEVKIVGVENQYDYEIYTQGTDQLLFSQFTVGEVGDLTFQGNTFFSQNSDLGNLIFPELKSKVYMFNAERFNVGVSGFGTNDQLDPSARNLPEVLNHLMGNNHRLFEELISYIRDMFPSITDLRVRPKENQQLEIVTWQELPEYQRPDLAISLQASGTGVGQVLSILYVVLTSRSPKTIIIDEPSNFLHPGATRHLMSILARHPQHQYILTTHSPEVLKSVEPTTVSLVRLIPPQSVVTSLNANEIADTLQVYKEVGARLSDVFGADAVLWVEGPTEEEAFRLILNKLGRLEAKVTIAAVMAVGDFDNKNRVKLVSEIYQKLSTGNSLLPSPIGFIFDREERTEDEMKELSRISNNKVKFITRRQYENFLLDVEAICAVLNALETFQENPIAPAVIEAWIKEKGRQNRYIKNYRRDDPINDETWIDKVDAAKLLKDMFAEISEHKESYRKTTDSIKITDWLIDNKPEKLSLLLRLIEESIASASSPTPASS